MISNRLKRSKRRFLSWSIGLALFCLLAYSSSAENTVHIVARGETIYSISRLYNVAQDELMRHNGITDASRLQAGMRLAIPAKIVTPSVSTVGLPYIEYTVSRNDTLYSLARIHGVTLQALRDINGFSPTYSLKAGEKIKIPVPAPAVTSVTTAPPTGIVPTVTTRRADPTLRWPIAAKEILYMSSNAGVLISGMEFESVKSLTGGTVVYASPWRGYGNVAVIELDGGYRYLYGACETLSVKRGDSIAPGTELGKLGIYPASGKPDLVFMVSQNGLPVDPAKAPRF